MKSLWLAVSLSVAAVSMSTLSLDAEAKRLGGGKAAGMQRQAPPPQQPTAVPASPNPAAAPVNSAAARPATPAAAAAAPAKRSWMGPIAGIAAGLGIAALMSHLGMGEAFGNFLTLALLAIVAVVAIRWLMGRFGSRKAAPAGGLQGMQLATAGGAPMPDERPAAYRPEPVMQRQAAEASPVLGAGSSAAATGLGAAAVAGGAAALPGFDAEGFERIAKMIFIRMQAANDAGDVEDLRKFTTPELFASLRLDLQERGNLAQRTDVVQLNAKVVETTREGTQNLVSVRFDGLIREETDGPAAPFDEVWHLVQPADGSREWAIAGITPVN